MNKKSAIVPAFIVVSETFLIYNGLTAKEFWYILTLQFQLREEMCLSGWTAPFQYRSSEYRLLSPRFIKHLLFIQRIYWRKITCLVRLYVLAFLIPTISFALVPTGLTAEEWVFVDLKPKANSRLDQQWWTGEKAASTLSFLPIGKTEDFAGPNDKKTLQYCNNQKRFRKSRKTMKGYHHQ